MARNIEEGVENAMELAIIAQKQAMEKLIPGTEEADTRSVLKAIWDPSCLTVQKQMDEVEAKLEELMPDVDIPSGKDIIQDISESRRANRATEAGHWQSLRESRSCP